MSSDLQVFHFDQTEPLRAGTTPDGVEFVIAADACKIAGHTNVSKALERLDDDEKGLTSADTPGGTQRLAYVTESGLYALVLSFRVRKDHPNYERLLRFRKWVTAEVLPAIRRTGRYEIAKPTGTLLEQARMLVKVIEHQEEQDRQLAAVEARTVQVEAKALEATVRADEAKTIASQALATV